MIHWIWQIAGWLLDWAVKQGLGFATWIAGFVGGLLHGGLSTLLDALNLPNPPQWLVDGAAMVALVMQWGGKLGHWIPWQLAVAVATTVLAVAFVGLGIVIVRIIASFASAGGGGT